MGNLVLNAVAHSVNLSCCNVITNNLDNILLCGCRKYLYPSHERFFLVCIPHLTPLEIPYSSMFSFCPPPPPLPLTIHGRGMDIFLKLDINTPCSWYFHIMCLIKVAFFFCLNINIQYFHYKYKVVNHGS